MLPDRCTEGRNLGTRLDRIRGFTLVEFIVVIFVVTIITGAVTVSVTDLNDNTRVSNAASRALADVRYAQEMAMSHRREADVIVDVGNQRYDIRWHDDSTFLPSLLDGSPLRVLMDQGLTDGVAITSSGLGGRLSFNDIGEPLIGGVRFNTEKSVMFLNSKVHVVIYPSGYSCLEETLGSGGCGGLGC
jgi:prepilin-type N-terminal cleavage/methylation domain-containing protein